MPSAMDPEQSAPEKSAPTESATDQQVVRAILETWAETTRTGQLDRVLENHAEHVLIFDVLPPMKYEGAVAYRRSWDEWQPETPDEGEFTLKDLVITTADGLAFAHGFIECGGVLPNGKRFADTVRATFCLQKQDESWKIVHQHISKPFSPSNN
jgi:ketosteroid isomerase-like protein